MPRVRLHHEGWLAVPAALRRKLGFKVGDRLELTPARDGLLLRRAPGALPHEPEQAAPAEQPAPPGPSGGPTKRPPAAAPPEPEVERPARKVRAKVALPPGLPSRGKRTRAGRS